MNMETITVLLSVSAVFAMCGLSIAHVMQEESDLLGFVAPWIEKEFGPASKLYKLATCPVCLGGQTALWVGFFLPAYDWPTWAHVLSVPLSIFWGVIFEKKLKV